MDILNSSRGDDNEPARISFRGRMHFQHSVMDHGFWNVSSSLFLRLRAHAPDILSNFYLKCKYMFWSYTYLISLTSNVILWQRPSFTTTALLHRCLSDRFQVPIHSRVFGYSEITEHIRLLLFWRGESDPLNPARDAGLPIYCIFVCLLDLRKRSTSTMFFDKWTNRTLQATWAHTESGRG